MIIFFPRVTVGMFAAAHDHWHLQRTTLAEEHWAQYIWASPS